MALGNVGVGAVEKVLDGLGSPRLGGSSVLMQEEGSFLRLPTVELAYKLDMRHPVCDMGLMSIVFN